MERINQMKLRLAGIVAVSIFLNLSTGTVYGSTQSDHYTIQCEVKLLLDSGQVLDEENLLDKSIRTWFQTGDEYYSFQVAYLDTPDREYLNEGWINRIRVKEGKKKYTLSYKKLYSADDFEAAMSEASEDGFTLQDPDFSVEVDWGYSKMTLSFKNEVKVKVEEEAELTSLGIDDVVEMSAGYMPSKERDWSRAGWGTETLEQAQFTGPVRFLRYIGRMDDPDIEELRIEIWPILSGEEVQHITEFSFICDSMEEAEAKRTSVIEMLDEMGILLHTDSLKTQMILNGGSNSTAMTEGLE